MMEGRVLRFGHNSSVFSSNRDLRQFKARGLVSHKTIFTFTQSLMEGNAPHLPQVHSSIRRHDRLHERATFFIALPSAKGLIIDELRSARIILCRRENASAMQLTHFQ
jgi:hypothetical protein